MNLNDLTKTQLCDLAKERGIKNYHRTAKADLIKKLEATPEAIQPSEPGISPALEFFNRVSVLTDIDAVESECQALCENLGLEKLLPKSQSNKLRPYSRLFQAMIPTAENLHLFFDFKAEGKETSIKRHLFFKLTGLADIDYNAEQEKVRERKAEATNKGEIKDEIADAIDATNKVFSLDQYIKTATLLLNSNDAWELASGLLAVSGRRPAEIVLKSDFSLPETTPSYIKHSEYAVNIEGLAKKRGQDIFTTVSLLIPATEFLSRLEFFRSRPEIINQRNLHEKLIVAGYDEETAYKKIEDQIGKLIRNATEFYFDFLPQIEGENRKNILLRACAIKLITERDNPTANTKGKLTYAGVLAGHIIPVFKDNTVRFSGKINASTLHYDDYEPDTKTIPFLKDVVTVAQKIEEPIKNIEEIEDMARIAQLESLIADLQKQLASKDSEIETLTQKLRSRNSGEKLPEVSEMNTNLLMGTRKAGSSEEKLNRCYQAMCNYNDSTPENKIAITNLGLRYLSGVNGATISKWMETHKDEIISHHAKHQLNTRENDATTYYNKRYGQTKVNQILDMVKSDYLHAID
jgi:hypothetical protein